MKDPCREAFESWAGIKEDAWDAAQNSDGSYVYYDHDVAWAAWKACWELQKEECAQICDNTGCGCWCGDSDLCASKIRAKDNTKEETDG